MSARSRGSRKRSAGRERAPRKPAAPLTSIQRQREHLLIDLGVTKSDIARAVGETKQNVSAVFLDKFRSLGPEGIEQKVIDYLRDVSGRMHREGGDPMVRPHEITRATLGWPELEAPESETPAERESHPSAGES